MKTRSTLVVVVAALLSAVLLAPALVYPYFEDAALFAAVARYLLDGETLYLDVFDHKAPAIYLQEMIRISILGPSALASRIVELVTLLVAGLGLGFGALAIRNSDQREPRLALLFLLPVSFCALTSSSLWGLPERGQVEFYQAAAVAIGLSAGLFAIENPRQHLAALVSGAALAWAAWLKPQAALLLVVFFLVLLWESKRTAEGKQRAWYLALGTLTISAIVLAFVLLSGSLAGLLQLFLEHHPAYLTGVRPMPPDLHVRFSYYFLSSPRNYVVAGLVVLGLLRLTQLARTGTIRWASWSLVVGTFTWGLIAFATGVAGFRYHAVPAMVGIAALSAWGLEGVLSIVSGGRGTPWRAIASGMLLGLMSVWMVATPRFRLDAIDLSRWLTGPEDLASVHERRGEEPHYYSYARELEAAQAVRDLVPEGQSIYVLGLAGVTYLLGDRPNAGRHLVTTFAYMPGYGMADSVHQEVVQTVRDRQPELLLVRANDSFPWFGLPDSSLQRLIQDHELLPIVQRDYEPLSRIDDYFLVFRRKSPSS